MDEMLVPTGGPQLHGTADGEWDIDAVCAAFLDAHRAGRVDRITRAYQAAEVAHRGVVRKSGAAYITHPLAVAGICTGLGLDEAAVCAALLHDVVEDTEMTLDDVRAVFEDGPGDTDGFGDEVASLVDGLTKLDGLEFDTEDGRRAAELRRLLANLARDPRVLVVKLADRLHNMRTIGALTPERQVRIARETAEVYAPLAHRLGISTVRSELEDAAFEVLAGDQYRGVERELAARRSGLSEEMGAMVAEVGERLDAAGVPARLVWRLKHAFGVWSKMQRTGKPFEEILDVVGLRVICADEAGCYAALGVVHSLYTPVPGSFTDYIAAPRLNRYQSLHTTVAGPGGRAVEVQIRSEEMHQVAEFGVASHWAYKESGGDEGVAAAMVDETAWMRRLLEAGGDAGEYLSAIHGDLARQEIYCLTPNGRLIALPEGSTPVDFAYAVHTEVGDRSVGARVNGAQVGLDHRLEDGDRVEILTSTDPRRGPNLDWANWVATGRARSLIRRWHVRHRRGQSAAVGRVRIREALESRSERTGADLPVDMDVALEAVCGRWGLRDGQALAAAVGEGRVHPDAVAARLLPEAVTVRVATGTSVDARVLVEGLSGVEVRLANCCGPAPFDPLVGWVSRTGGVSVHQTGCTNVADLLARDSGRVVSVSWAAGTRLGLSARVRIDSFDRPGLVAAVAGCLADAGADIKAMTAESGSGLARQVYEVTVGGATVLEELERALWSLPGTTQVQVTEQHGER